MHESMSLKYEPALEPLHNVPSPDLAKRQVFSALISTVRAFYKVLEVLYKVTNFKCTEMPKVGS